MERQRSLLRELSPLPLPSMATPGSLRPSYTYQGESHACHKPVTPQSGCGSGGGGRTVSWGDWTGKAEKGRLGQHLPLTHFSTGHC